MKINLLCQFEIVLLKKIRIYTYVDKYSSNDKSL
jgi:hypothetical protein